MNNDNHKKQRKTKKQRRKALRLPTFPSDKVESMPEMQLTGQTCTRPRIRADTGSWKIQRRHLPAAIDHSKAHSASGPDGLPYAFWKSIPEVANTVLWNITRSLAEGNSTELQDEAYRYESYTFNGSIWACLPTTPSQHTKRRPPSIRAVEYETTGSKQH